MHNIHFQMEKVQIYTLSYLSYFKQKNIRKRLESSEGVWSECSGVEVDFIFFPAQPAVWFELDIMYCWRGLCVIN